jgi:hypothetical protein
MKESKRLIELSPTELKNTAAILVNVSSISVLQQSMAELMISLTDNSWRKLSYFLGKDFMKKALIEC